jgi:hypothetical protein
MRQFPQILRHAIRISCRDPGFIAIAVLTLAVGIGAATAAMSVAASVLRNPLPVRTIHNSFSSRRPFRQVQPWCPFRTRRLRRGVERAALWKISQALSMTARGLGRPTSADVQ